MPETANTDATQTYIPTNKTLAATGGSVVGGSLASIIIYMIEQHSGAPLPEAVSGAATVLVSAAVTFLAGWLTPHGANEHIMPESGKKHGRTRMVSRRHRRGRHSGRGAAAKA